LQSRGSFAFNKRSVTSTGVGIVRKLVLGLAWISRTRGGEIRENYEDLNTQKDTKATRAIGLRVATISDSIGYD